jgi:predicted XRE-type DNA-binding protein
MNWTSIISRLQERGLSQAQIAAACGCGQATISDLARSGGGTKEPRFSLGKALIALADASDEEIERLKAGKPAPGAETETTAKVA